MANVKLESYQVLKLNYSNESNLQNKIEVKTSINTNVSYDREDSKCFCTYSLIVQDVKEKNEFNIEVKVKGVFTFAEAENKREVHVEAARKLYPYLQTTASSLFSTIGIPNFILPEFAMKLEDVVEAE